MKELYYVIQTLIHGRGANLIKVYLADSGFDGQYLDIRARSLRV